MLDLVAALQWVRDNIANFGGDAGNVTIFGQSGGGAKVTVLLSMPRAKGLFHKAAVQSGSALGMPEPEITVKLAEAVVKELDTDVARLQTIPVDRLIAAGAAAAKRAFPPIDFSRPIDFESFFQRMAWAPTVDGNILPAQPVERFAAQDVPLLVGSTLTEFAVGFDNPDFDALTTSELLKRMTRAHGEKAPAVLDAFRRGHPGAKPADLFTIWFSSGVRRAAIHQAVIKAAQGTGPAYLYWFAWYSPVLDGRIRAVHCMELPFVFDNTDRCETMTGGGPDARALAARISQAWIGFARTGDPNHGGLPKWAPFTTARRTTMVFNNFSEAKDDPDGAELKALMEQNG
jgi:para-nitrobenzyl esterase